jgi:hypothetical protein
VDREVLPLERLHTASYMNLYVELEATMDVRRKAAGTGAAARNLLLSPAQQRLVALMQEINFGRIEARVFRDGEPLLEPRPPIVDSFKAGGEKGSRLEAGSTDFVLKQGVVDLFECLHRHGVGVVRIIVVANGLPHRLEIEKTT